MMFESLVPNGNFSVAVFFIADLSLKAVSDSVTKFKKGDYYQVSLDSAERILEVSKENQLILLRAIKPV